MHRHPLRSEHCHVTHRTADSDVDGSPTRESLRLIAMLPFAPGWVPTTPYCFITDSAAVTDNQLTGAYDHEFISIAEHCRLIASAGYDVKAPDIEEEQVSASDSDIGESCSVAGSGTSGLLAGHSPCFSLFTSLSPAQRTEMTMSFLSSKNVLFHARTPLRPFYGQPLGLEVPSRQSVAYQLRKISWHH